MAAGELEGELRKAGMISSDSARLSPIAGGVSSDIFLVEDGDRRFVVKQALDQLRVKDEWLADRSRNRTEQDYFAYVAGILPGVVPQIIYADPDQGWFAMEYLAGEWRNWKTDLLAGQADPAVARRVGDTLGRLHRASWGDPAARSRFATLKNFTDLRISPYLLSTAERVPDLRRLLRAEAQRLGATELALVHGDYSPKNLLIAPGRLMILDAEVAWFGDPTFDVAFLLNHFHLKALYHASRPASDAMLGLAAEAWKAYAAALGPRDADLEARSVHLMLCLMLARVHGKSPVEYLTAPGQGGIVSEFVHRHLPRSPTTFSALGAAWREAIQPRRSS